MPDTAASDGSVHYPAPAWHVGGGRILQPTGRPLVMGILNLTPDSFHPDSRVTDPAQVTAAGLAMVAAGADLLDLGAESSRPGSEPVGAAQERARLLPSLRELRRHTDVPISIDTVRAETARAALGEGADAINDISAATHDAGMLPLIAQQRCGVVLMHMQGTPRTMQENPQYDDVVAEVGVYLGQRIAAATAAGIAPDAIAVDPGLGFGKRLAHNLALLGALDRLGAGQPILLGASRKGFIADLTNAPVAERLAGSLAALAAAFAAGVAIVRVHDVAPSLQFLTTLAGIAGVQE